MLKVALAAGAIAVLGFVLFLPAGEPPQERVVLAPRAAAAVPELQAPSSLPVVQTDSTRAPAPSAVSLTRTRAEPAAQPRPTMPSSTGPAVVIDAPRRAPRAATKSNEEEETSILN